MNVASIFRAEELSKQEADSNKGVVSQKTEPFITTDV
jgi:hypothetical protein